MKINKTCETCEFNFNGICGGNGFYKYGEKIIDIQKIVIVGVFHINIFQKL